MCRVRRKTRANHNLNLNIPLKATSLLAQTQKDAVFDAMTTLLDQGIQAIRELPDERQDMAGEILLTLAAAAPRYKLTPEQIEDLKLAIAQADRGEFASDEEVAAMWNKFGL
jgi:hypothetical protein